MYILASPKERKQIIMEFKELYHIFLNNNDTKFKVTQKTDHHSSVGFIPGSNLMMKTIQMVNLIKMFGL